MSRVRFVLIITVLFYSCATIAQDLFTARGYWEECNKDNYKKIIEKKQRGDVLTANEKLYLTTYEDYLLKYYQRMSLEEQEKYERMKPVWDAEVASKEVPQKPSGKREFTWGINDHFNNAIYGMYYGIVLMNMVNDDDGKAAGIPFITAGLWQLGPVIRPKKYEGINATTMRASGAGKCLGLGYGLALGFAIGGSSSDYTNLILGLSAIGSIGLGEAAFQIQKKKQYSEGHVELMRHYGFLGPSVTLLSAIALENDNTNAAGVSALVGGIGGLYLGSRAAKNYNYTLGDVFTIRSNTWIYAGLGFALAGQAAEGSDERNRGLFLVPAATAIAGTVVGQRMIKGVYLSDQQGRTINLATGGAALIGLGLVASFKTESVGALVGVPSVVALVTHQFVFHKYKKKNAEKKIETGSNSKYRSHFSLDVTPENYFVNQKQNPERLNMINGRPALTHPIVTISLTF